MNSPTINLKQINHINPAIIPRASHIENYVDSKTARNTFMQVSTLKNIENGSTNLKSSPKKVNLKQNLSVRTNEYPNSPQKYVVDKSQLLDSSSMSPTNASKMLSRAVSAGHDMSEVALKRMEESKEIFIESKNTGKEALIAELGRKELENHVRILENRLMKLRIEEKNMQKKILDTSDKTEKTLQSKLRHQEDLTEKQMRRSDLERQLDQKRQELNNKRESDTNSRKMKTQMMLQGKQSIATDVKDIKQDARSRKDSNKTDYLSQSAQLIQKIRGDDNSRKSERLDKENEKKMMAKTQFHGRLNTNNETKQTLENKLKELEEQEQFMIEKLKQTYDLHKNKYQEYQKVFNTKVLVGEPLDVSMIHNVDQQLHEQDEHDVREFYPDQDHEGQNGDN